MIISSNISDDSISNVSAIPIVAVCVVSTLILELCFILETRPRRSPLRTVQRGGKSRACRGAGRLVRREN